MIVVGNQPVEPQEAWSIFEQLMSQDENVRLKFINLVQAARIKRMEEANAETRDEAEATREPTET